VEIIVILLRVGSDGVGRKHLGGAWEDRESRGELVIEVVSSGYA
jgi:hypothetical protein